MASLEEIISARAKERRLARQAKPEEIVAEGYRPEEVDAVLALRARMQGWAASAEVSEYVTTRRAEWEARLEREGKEPRTYRFFHTIVGSTLPADTEYKESPDLPGEDSVYALADSIDAGIAQMGETMH